MPRGFSADGDTRRFTAPLGSRRSAARGDGIRDFGASATDANEVEIPLAHRTERSAVRLAGVGPDGVPMRKTMSPGLHPVSPPEQRA